MKTKHNKLSALILALSTVLCTSAFAAELAAEGTLATVCVPKGCVKAEVDSSNNLLRSGASGGELVVLKNLKTNEMRTKEHFCESTD